MLNNNNRAAIRLIAKRSMKSNRTRNLFAVLAVILSTFMFTTVFSIGFSLAQNMVTMMVREQGSKASVFLAQPSKQQQEQIKKAKHLYAAGVRVNVEKIELEDERVLSLDYYDKIEFEKNYLPAISDVKGAYPEKENEIMLSNSALEELHIKNPKIGMEITLDLKEGEQSFKLSGYFQDYQDFSTGLRTFVSAKYIEQRGMTLEEDGLISISAQSGAREQLLKELFEQVELRDGQEFSGNVDYQNESGSTYLMVGLAVFIVSLIIVLSGYLLIYNIMYISVTKDIRFYGMLKTIGASPKQIKKIVRMQSFYFCAFGIPIGILLGVFVSFGAVPMAMSMFGGSVYSAMPATISFNPFIYAGTVLFAVATVALSCRKPARMASRITPIEALKYHGVSLSNKKKSKKQNKTEQEGSEQRQNDKMRSKDGGKTYKMAWRNVFREKKRAMIVFLSLFMGTMAFLSFNAFLGSMKLENYIDYYLPDDFTIYTRETNLRDDADGNETNASDAIENDADEESVPDIAPVKALYDKLAQIKGVKKIELNRVYAAKLEYDEQLFWPFLDAAENEIGTSEFDAMREKYRSGEFSYEVNVFGVSAEMMERYNKKADQKLDIEKFKKGEVCMLGFLADRSGADEMLGKTIGIQREDGEKSIEIEIGSVASAETRYGLNTGYYWQDICAPEAIFVCQDVIDQLTAHPGADNIIIDADEGAESYVRSQIKQLADKHPSVMHVEVKSEMISEFKSSMLAMNLLSGGISSVLILIGVLNFINVMLTGVYTRRRELAVLESVGMTKKQIMQMLMFEGLYYAAITLGLILTVGTLIVFMLANLAAHTADYAIFYYPVMPMIVINLIIFLICLSVPIIVYRILSKSSVTERLREAE